MHHIYVWECIDFLSLVCLHCMGWRNSKLTREHVSHNRRFPPLISPSSSASTTVYTALLQSKSHWQDVAVFVVNNPKLQVCVCVWVRPFKGVWLRQAVMRAVNCMEVFSSLLGRHFRSPCSEMLQIIILYEDPLVDTVNSICHTL